VKIFLSYRRDDTAGRAGRLYDVLVNRFGARNVFQDVATIEPGTDFMQRVSEALAASDVALVVIGGDWVTATEPGGGRRLDDPDDFVRREVSAALAAGLPVVPVLVAGAELPAADELPEDLRALVNRQAARLRDESWHLDVDALVRRLEGEAVVAPPPRMGPLIVGAAAIVAIVAVGVVWVRDRDAEGGDDDDSDAIDSIAPCLQADATWTSIPLDLSAPAETNDGANRSFVLTAEAADYKDQGGSTVIVARLRLDNTTGPEVSPSDFYLAPSDIDSLFVDGVSIGPPTCFSMVSANRTIERGEAARFRVGFEGPYEAGAPLVIKTIVGDMDLQLTAGT
jgi:hypothetical protein